MLVLTEMTNMAYFRLSFVAAILLLPKCSSLSANQIPDSVVAEPSELEGIVEQLVERNLYPEEVWLGDDVEVCRNGKNRYGRCDKSRFPRCPKTHDLCFRRARRKDGVFYNNNPEDPYYYIDYNKVYCRKVEKGKPFNCSSCTPGTWCPSLNRCTWRPYNNCPDDHRYKAKQKALLKKMRREERKKKRAERIRKRKEMRMQEREAENSQQNTSKAPIASSILFP